MGGLRSGKLNAKGMRVGQLRADQPLLLRPRRRKRARGLACPGSAIRFVDTLKRVLRNERPS
jgi:hypothetical protein